MSKTISLILCCLITQLSFGQIGGNSGGPEVLGPLKVNASISAAKQQPTTLAKSPGTQFYFVLDTLSLPFIDDFSTYNLKSYDTLTYNQALVVDSISFDFTINAVAVDSFICVADTTWSYIFSDVDSSLVTKTALTPYTRVNYNDPYNPFVPTDTSTCWTPYEIYDTLNQTSPDTIDSLGIVIDTLRNTFDTLRVYPPDTGVGGKVLSYWIDEDAYINNRYPVDPPTLGVATFDGLDEFGVPHNAFADPTGYGVADFLTSKPIDLSFTSTDSIYLSFYYQPQGIGNDPQAPDSLVLEFYAPEKLAWHNIWSVPGREVHNFRNVILPISSTDYLKKGFQFRFKNYATISGNFDHWNVDYVRIDKDRDDFDSTLRDVGIVSATRSIYTTYEAVPWKHYLLNPTLNLVPQMDVKIHNLDVDSNFCGYRYTIKHNDGVIDSSNIQPSGTNNAEVSPQSTLDRFLPLSYLCNWSTETDSAEFEITSFLIPEVQDTIRANDTLRYIQQFHNYYAYDDGTAEHGYGLNAAGGKLAYRFTNIVADTLRAIDMYFVQDVYDHTDKDFYLTVWTSLTPETIVYQEKNVSPFYEDSLNEFHTYLMDTVLILSGTYYIGWVQETDDVLNVGFDVNSDHSSSIYYNVAGTWLQSLTTGTVMMRPLFGDSVILPMMIEEQDVIEPLTSQFSIFPNPAIDFIQVDKKAAGQSGDELVISILDMFGREVLSVVSSSGRVDIQELSEGIYFVKIRRPNSREYETKKIFVSH